MKSGFKFTPAEVSSSSRPAVNRRSPTLNAAAGFFLPHDRSSSGQPSDPTASSSRRALGKKQQRRAAVCVFSIRRPLPASSYSSDEFPAVSLPSARAISDEQPLASPSSATLLVEENIPPAALFCDCGAPVI